MWVGENAVHVLTGDGRIDLIPINNVTVAYLTDEVIPRVQYLFCSPWIESDGDSWSICISHPILRKSSLHVYRGGELVFRFERISRSQRLEISSGAEINFKPCPELVSNHRRFDPRVVDPDADPAP